MTSTVPTPVRPPRTEQTYWEKGWEKCKQQPFVPIGIFATCVAFAGATQQLRKGDQKSFNRFLRFRVVAQGVTIAACVVGSFVYSKQNAIDRANERSVELDKIRLAGTGTGTGAGAGAGGFGEPSASSTFGETPRPPSSSSSSSSPSLSSHTSASTSTFPSASRSDPPSPSPPAGSGSGSGAAAGDSFWTRWGISSNGGGGNSR